jgi:hypothetical protein
MKYGETEVVEKDLTHALDFQVATFFTVLAFVWYIVCAVIQKNTVKRLEYLRKRALH